MNKLLFALLLFAQLSFAQTNVTVMFLPLFQGKAIELNKEIIDSAGAKFEFTTLRFYCSSIHYTDYSGQELMDEDYHLVDLEDTASLTIIRHNEGIQNLWFLLGTDSLTNVSGNLEGPLDPINGMYWAWNSGYINFKLEGKSSLSVAKDKSFEFHIGGYLPPFPTVQELFFNVNSNSKVIILEVNIDQFLMQVDLSKDYAVMIPGEKASNFADQLVTIFKIRNDGK